MHFECLRATSGLRPIWYGPKRQRIRCLTGGLAAALLLSGCGEVRDPSAGKPRDQRVGVCVSIPPIAYFTERIGGEHVEVTVLVRPGQSPETYDPTPRQIAQLSESRLFFAIGLPFERRLSTKIEGMGTGTEVVNLNQGITLRTMASQPWETVEQGAMADPHVWMSPRNAKHLAETICETLRKADPAHASLYEQNAAALTRDLEGLDSRIAALLTPFSGKRFYVYHPAFGYLADAYGIEQVAVEVQGKEPTSKELAELINQAKTDGAQVLLVQEQFPTRAAEAVAQAVGCHTVRVDPLAYDYLTNLEHIAQVIRMALLGKREAGS